MRWVNNLISSRDGRNNDPIYSSFSWNSPECGELTMLLKVPLETYNYFRMRRRLLASERTSRSYAVMAADPASELVLRNVVRRLRSFNCDPMEAVITFVQSGVRYLRDGISTGLGEFPRFPLETLVEGGDCEDKSILLANLLRSLGVEGVHLLFLKDHVALGVPCSSPNVGDLCYLEASGGYFKVGDVPEGVILPPESVYEVADLPIPAPLEVNAHFTGGRVSIVGKVVNVGSKEYRGKVFLEVGDSVVGEEPVALDLDDEAEVSLDSKLPSTGRIALKFEGDPLSYEWVIGTIG
ncbi:MAG: hypothetical protein QI197_04640 [Candidatus Korarchaeota archaeon]|nr:hypothetical protein [Candidatus Korarchaeota archaeon]